MDILSMILARNQSGSSGGNTETKKYTFNGNASGKEMINIGYNMVKVSDECLDLSSVTKVKWAVGGDEADVFGVHIVFPDEDDLMYLAWQTTYRDDTTGSGSISNNLPDGTPVVLLVPEDSEAEDGAIWTKGTYFFCDTTDDGYHGYISLVLTETIHPIDPKYIPEPPTIPINADVMLSQAGKWVALSDALVDMTADVALEKVAQAAKYKQQLWIQLYVGGVKGLCVESSGFAHDGDISKFVGIFSDIVDLGTGANLHLFHFTLNTNGSDVDAVVAVNILQ